MPFVKINLRQGRSSQDKQAIGQAVQAALVNTLKIPDADLYQIFCEHTDEHFRHTDAYLGMEYSQDLLMLEIAFIEGRPDERKKALLADLCQRLVATGKVRADDVFVVISEGAKTNFSFGKGIAQKAA